MMNIARRIGTRREAGRRFGRLRLAGTAARAWLSRRQTWAALAAAALAFVLWVELAPPQLGGSTTYVIAEGHSMLPRFRGGDLVILRGQPSYHAGEVAAYRNRQLGIVVMHRIIAVHGTHYVFKGDNNDFVDTYEPPRTGIVGVVWLHLPAVGTYLQRLRAPVAASMLLAALGLFALWPQPKSRHQRRRRHHAY